MTELFASKIGDWFVNLWNSTGFKTAVPDYYVMNGYSLGIWGQLIMLVIAAIFLFLAIAKKFEPNLLLAIAFGMFIINIPGAYSVLYGQGGYTFTDEAGRLIASGTLEQLCSAYGLSYSGASAEALQTSFDGLINFMQTNWNGSLGAVGAFGADCYTYGIIAEKGLFYYLYKGVDWVIFPPLIFLGIGAMTDFGPLIANPKSLLLGAAAQLGIFITFIGALLLGFNEAAAFFDSDYRRSGRTDCYISHAKNGTKRPFTGDCRSRILVYGSRSRNSTAYNETSYDEERTFNPYGTTSPRKQERKNNVPGNRYGRCGNYSSVGFAFARNAYARQPYKRIGRSSAFERNRAKRTYQYNNDFPRNNGRYESVRARVLTTSNA